LTRRRDLRTQVAQQHSLAVESLLGSCGQPGGTARHSLCVDALQRMDCSLDGSLGAAEREDARA
jgi:hypothetical protein